MTIMVAKSKIMGNFNVSGPLKIIGWTAIVVMAAAAIGTAATAFSYLVGSRKSIAKKNVTLIDELRGSGDKSVGNVPTFAAGRTLRRLRAARTGEACAYLFGGVSSAFSSHLPIQNRIATTRAATLYFAVPEARTLSESEHTSQSQSPPDCRTR
jgi:hypothetical protein